MRRYEMKATGRIDSAANEKVVDVYSSNLQLEEQLHGVRREVQDAKAIAEKVCCSESAGISAQVVTSKSCTCCNGISVTSLFNGRARPVVDELQHHACLPTGS